MLFARVYIGTSGWDYDDWIGPFYNRDKNLFSQYARVFKTVEINSTFYSLPSKNFIEGLTRVAPKDFIFSLKLYRGVTHKKLLKPEVIGHELDFFFKSISPLRASGKLGAVLIQLPPKPKEELTHFKDFLAMLPKGYRFAVEFRHPSWLTEEAFKILEDFNIAYTIVDEPLLPPQAMVTADFSYIRWHGRSQSPWYYYHYSLDELQAWAKKIGEITEKVSLLLGYFNNHFRGFAPHNALQMLALLGMLDRERRYLLAEMDKYFSAMPKETLEEAKTALEEGNIETILKALAGDKRFERGVEIDSKEVSYGIEEGKVYGKVKDYYILIDQSSRLISHNCEDWRKSLETKRFCKHMVKFFITLPRELSLQLLKDILTNIDDWEFVANTSGLEE
ncbi:MAG: DUF72 domain-containing protein [Infirmifilum sp.]